MNSAKDIELTGEGAGDRFGSAVNGAGDLNNDGFADLLIGAWGYSGNTGKVYLYKYGMNGTLFSDLTMTGEATSNRLRYSVSSAGDLNGDGFLILQSGLPIIQTILEGFTSCSVV